MALRTTVAAARIGLIWTYSAPVQPAQRRSIPDEEEKRERTQDAPLETEESERVARIHRAEEEADREGVLDGLAAVKGDDERAFAATVEDRCERPQKKPETAATHRYSTSREKKQLRTQASVPASTRRAENAD